ncbi:MAG: type II toxin-antitoxin system VapC family toxin [Planctomycetes bacterium]|jgi:tRNA(fMet)-specific endonuclease VapC|nr:type II toxin-antitoxin system VapC family toxin [Planctomycetota bacterium]
MTLLLRQRSMGGGSLTARLSLLPLAAVHVSIISFQEQAQGWLAYIKRARKPPDVLRGFFDLQELLKHYSILPVFPFDQSAMDEFTTLKGQSIRIGTADLRIAAIAKANNAKLLSRNLRYFQKVPALDVEDWTL